MPMILFFNFFFLFQVAVLSYSPLDLYKRTKSFAIVILIAVAVVRFSKHLASFAS